MIKWELDRALEGFGPYDQVKVYVQLGDDQWIDLEIDYDKTCNSRGWIVTTPTTQLKLADDD